MFGNSTPMENNTEITDVRILAKEFMMYKIGMLHYTSLVKKNKNHKYIYSPPWRKSIQF